MVLVIARNHRGDGRLGVLTSAERGTISSCALTTPAAAADGPRRHQKLRGLKGSVLSDLGA